MTEPTAACGSCKKPTLRRLVSTPDMRWSTDIVSHYRPVDDPVSAEYRKFLWFDTELSISCHHGGRAYPRHIRERLRTVRTSRRFRGCIYQEADRMALSNRRLSIGRDNKRAFGPCFTTMRDGIPDLAVRSLLKSAGQRRQKQHRRLHGQGQRGAGQKISVGPDS